MGQARARVRFAGTVAEAEALWYDLGRWASFIDGFANVVRDEGWPRAGGVLVWDSTPAGRGRVVERVGDQSAGEGQVAEIEDPRLEGRQVVAFAEPAPGEVEVVVTLDYRLKSGGPLRPVLDLLFIRRAIRDSLRRTLTRFAREVESDRELR